MKLLLTMLLFVTVTTTKASNEVVLTEKNTVVYNEQVSAVYSAQKALEILKKIPTIPAGQQLYLVLYTPGGSVTAGLDFINAINKYKNKISTITVFSASMGHHFVQALGERLILPTGTLMQHKATIGGLGGTIPGEVQSRLSHIMQLLDEMDANASNRIGQNVETYRSSVANDLWMVGKRAVELKHADRVVNASCSQDLLSKTYEKTVNVMFFSATVVYSGCPLIVAPIAIKGTDAENVERVKLHLDALNKRPEMTL